MYVMKYEDNGISGIYALCAREWEWEGTGSSPELEGHPTLNLSYVCAAEKKASCSWADDGGQHKEGK